MSAHCTVHNTRVGIGQAEIIYNNVKHSLTDESKMFSFYNYFDVK